MSKDKCEIEMAEFAFEAKAKVVNGSLHDETNSPTFDQTADSQKERRFIRKLDRRILPWIMLLYMLSYLDRSNLGNSVPLGLLSDLRMSSSEYSIAGSVFYVATFAFGTIGGLMLKVVPPRMWIAGCLFGWGAMAAIQASAHNFAGIVACRFFLGVFEASFAPGCAFYLSFWYLKDELTLRVSAYAGTSALAGVIGGLASYACGYYKGPLQPWQVLFIAEGVATASLAVPVYFVLPDRPEINHSSMFTEEEQAIALSRRSRYITTATQKGIAWGEVKAGLSDYRLWLFAVMYAGLSLSLGVISIFLPTVLNSLGFESYKANLMTVPLYAVGYLGLLLVAWASGKYQQRAIPIAIASTLGGIGYLLLGLCKDNGPRFFGSFLIVAGTYWSFPVVLSWISNTFATDSKSATGLGAVIAVTHAVGVASAYVYPSSSAPQYFTGSIVSASLMFLAAMMAIGMRMLLARENKLRDELYGIPVIGAIEMGSEADKNTSFRYIL